jgi:hypothetical protein
MNTLVFGGASLVVAVVIVVIAAAVSSGRNRSVWKCANWHPRHHVLTCAEPCSFWAQAYERDLKDVLTLQANLAQDIAGEIQLSCSLITQKQLFDFVPGVNRDGSGEQMFALANIANEHRFEDQPQGESCIVAEHLAVVWRIAIDEFDREAELVCIEITGTLDVRNEELCRD